MSSSKSQSLRRKARGLARRQKDKKWSVLLLNHTKAPTLNSLQPLTLSQPVTPLSRNIYDWLQNYSQLSPDNNYPSLPPMSSQTTAYKGRQSSIALQTLACHPLDASHQSTRMLHYREAAAKASIQLLRDFNDRLFTQHPVNIFAMKTSVSSR